VATGNKTKLISAKARYGKFYVCRTPSISMIPKLNFAAQPLRWIFECPLKKKYFLLKKIIVKRAQNAAILGLVLRLDKPLINNSW